MTQTELQKTFIAMLFAFVASTVAQQIAELLVVITNNWTSATSPFDIYENIHSYFWLLMPTFMHSVLALLLFSMSWVMWSKSAAHKKDIEDVFSKKYLVLLFEVVLVVLYFAVAKSNEADFAAYTRDKAITSFVGTPSAKPEALQIFWVFSLFVVWDYLVDVFQSPRENHPTALTSKVAAHLQGVITYCSTSLVCAALAYLVSRLAPVSGTPYQATFGDIALIMSLLLFNRAKAFEYYLRKVFPEEKTRQTTARDTPISSLGLTLIAILTIIYIFSVTAMAFPCILK
ncbi:TPA: hypothetical protein SL211_005323 [Pseudomonas aeruginosa]|nr:hypothetical protein [Pseudomonas aeruginosa]HEJ1126036.1 hypothetical protein [Pseudomonas aeruginosa]HEJ2679720.1 hypothetical protein [Pseudomonas aeruginosa]